MMYPIRYLLYPPSKQDIPEKKKERKKRKSLILETFFSRKILLLSTFYTSAYLGNHLEKVIYKFVKGEY